jgi:CBS domain-containing protein
MTVQDVMTALVVTVGPETTLKEVARRLVNRGISGIVVVDDDRRVLGVVSEADLLIKEQGAAALPHRRGSRFLGESREAKMAIAKAEATTAGEAMTSPAITIEPRTSVPAAAAIMVERHINRLPVTHDGRLVGIVSRADLVRAYVRTDDQLAETIRTDLFRRHLSVNPVVFDIAVLDGVVSIRGQAETRSLAVLMERLVRELPGVIAVDADLTWARDDTRTDAMDPDLVSLYTR